MLYKAFSKRDTRLASRISMRCGKGLTFLAGYKIHNPQGPLVVEPGEITIPYHFMKGNGFLDTDIESSTSKVNNFDDGFQVVY